MTAGTAGLLDLPVADLKETLAASHLGWWTQLKAGLPMTPLHWEWCRLRMTAQRLAVVAPREHAKTETFTVNGTAWDSIYKPGTWTYIFAQTGDQSLLFLERTITAIENAEPWLVDRARSRNTTQIILGNGSKISVAGAGKAVRAAHPDVIIGDDVMSDGSTGTEHQRKQQEKWWFGTVANMAHPPTTRAVKGADGEVRRLAFPATRIMLVGTPFHRQDLLMGMRDNLMYSFRRYKAEFDERELKWENGRRTWAVEIR